MRSWTRRAYWALALAEALTLTLALAVAWMLVVALTAAETPAEMHATALVPRLAPLVARLAPAVATCANASAASVPWSCTTAKMAGRLVDRVFANVVRLVDAPPVHP
jgi:hypothetical protein